MARLSRSGFHTSTSLLSNHGSQNQDQPMKTNDEKSKGASGDQDQTKEMLESFKHSLKTELEDSLRTKMEGWETKLDTKLGKLDTEIETLQQRIKELESDNKKMQLTLKET
jgi:hypothetical protein